jgi:cholesterol transport system auxiliary component
MNPTANQRRETEPEPRPRVALPAVCVVAVMFASGCTLTSEPAMSYQLAPVVAKHDDAAGASAAGAAVPLVLMVGRPRAAGPLDTDRIAIAPGGSRFDYYAGVRWSQTAPQMVQQTLVDALTSDGHFEAVLAAPAFVPAELLLDVELRRFEAVAAGVESAPVAHVQVQASLVDSRRAVRVASFLSEASATASDNRMGAVVAAFDAATAKVVQEIVQRVREAPVTARAAAPSAPR